MNQTTDRERATLIQQALKKAGRGLVERQSLVELIGLAAVAGEHVLVLGPPGTAKSEAVRQVAQTLNGQYFEYLLGRFTEPSELFGPVNLEKLKRGFVETDTTGMLPEAEIAFLDEVFLGSTAILNTLLSILNERQFRRGHTMLECPLRVCVGAANHLPDAAELQAFSDRFLVRYFADPVSDPMIETLLAAGWGLSGSKTQTVQSLMPHIDLLRTSALSMNLDSVRPLLGEAYRRLRKEGIVLSDRRAVRAQKMIAAAAVLGGRKTPSRADLWPLVFVMPTRSEQVQGQEVLAGLLKESENPVLAHAAALASSGPKARAELLLRTAKKLLQTELAKQDQGWLLKLEGMLREIDSGFDEKSRPETLNAVRSELIRKVSAGWEKESKAGV